MAFTPVGAASAKPFLLTLIVLNDGQLIFFFSLVDQSFHPWLNELYDI